MCENLKYWVRLYMARVIKGGLIVVATGFLFFQCSFGLNEDPVADSDGDGLIEIKDATMLNNMRYNLAGTSYKSSADDAGDANGCPASGCNGYELTADIDLLSLLDANNNGRIDTTTVSVVGKTHTVIDTSTGQDKSWVPIGDNSTGFDESRFSGIFEGNNHTIANLWVNVSSSSDRVYAGLFGYVSGRTSVVEIRNIGIISGSIHSSSSSSYSGGLVGYAASSLTIKNCIFSDSDGVSSSSSSSSYSGGLVGDSQSTVTITNCTFSGSGGVSSAGASGTSGGLVGRSNSPSTITNCTFSDSIGVSSSSSSSSSSFSFSGGVIGNSEADLVITNCIFSGSGEISSSSDSSSSVPLSRSYSRSGGLVGRAGSSSSLTITNCTFSGSGEISSSAAFVSGLASSLSGALVGEGDTLTIMSSYWNIDASQMKNNSPQNPKRAQGGASSNPAGAVDLTLMQLKATSGMHPSDLLLPTPGVGDAWDLGTDMQLPAIKTCVNPTVTNNVVTCASYGDLLAGQR